MLTASKKLNMRGVHSWVCKVACSIELSPEQEKGKGQELKASLSHTTTFW